eukprot:1162015-Pelagomonas_calceolata.AAC.11
MHCGTRKLRHPSAVSGLPTGSLSPALMRLEPCFKLLFLTYTFKAGSASSALSPPATNAVAAPGVAAGVLTRAPAAVMQPTHCNMEVFVSPGSTLAILPNTSLAEHVPK